MCIDLHLKDCRFFLSIISILFCREELGVNSEKPCKANDNHTPTETVNENAIIVSWWGYTIVRLNKRGKKSGCIWQPAQLYRVRIMMPMLSIAFLYWFATFQTQTSSTVKSDSIFQGLVYSNFLPPLFNPSIG